MSGPKVKIAFSGRIPEYHHLFLLPLSKAIKPVAVKVWAYRTKEGWTGWLESQRKPGLKSPMPSDYSKLAWKEVSEKQAEKAMKGGKVQEPAVLATVQAVQKQAEAGKSAARTDVKRRPGKGPVKVATPEPEPTPPTGTDPGQPDGSNEEIAGALELAVQTLGTVAQSIRRVTAQSQGKQVSSKPGLRKTVAPAPVKRRAKR